MNSKKHSYICYAAISKDGQSIFEYRYEPDSDNGETEWFDQWQFGEQKCLELVPDCAYMDGWQDILQEELNRQNIDAQIKKYKIIVQEMND